MNGLELKKLPGPFLSGGLLMCAKAARKRSRCENVIFILRRPAGADLPLHHSVFGLARLVLRISGSKTGKWRQADRLRMVTCTVPTTMRLKPGSINDKSVASLFNSPGADTIANNPPTRASGPNLIGSFSKSDLFFW